MSCPVLISFPLLSRRLGLRTSATFAIPSVSWGLLSSPPCPTFLAGSARSRRSRLRARQDEIPAHAPPLRRRRRSQPALPPAAPSRWDRAVGPRRTPPALPGHRRAQPKHEGPGCTAHTRGRLCCGRADIDAVPIVPVPMPFPLCPRQCRNQGVLGPECTRSSRATNSPCGRGCAGLCQGWEPACPWSPIPSGKGDGCSSAHPSVTNSMGALLKRRVPVWRLIVREARA